MQGTGHRPRLGLGPEKGQGSRVRAPAQVLQEAGPQGFQGQEGRNPLGGPDAQEESLGPRIPLQELQLQAADAGAGGAAHLLLQPGGGKVPERGVPGAHDLQASPQPQGRSLPGHQENLGLPRGSGCPGHPRRGLGLGRRSPGPELLHGLGTHEPGVQGPVDHEHRVLGTQHPPREGLQLRQAEAPQRLRRRKHGTRGIGQGLPQEGLGARQERPLRPLAQQLLLCAGQEGAIPGGAPRGQRQSLEGGGQVAAVRT